MSALPRLSPAELKDSGLLLEANRRFFHPLGLALAVDAPNVEAEDGETREAVWERMKADPDLCIVILDDRQDPEGWYFYDGDLIEDAAKIAAVAAVEAERRPVREAALGYWIQPTSGQAS